ncbi:histidinol-phosphate transaminase [Sinorhizobium sp. BG8]|uniref:histidinol-phosphate transaminase n=1 Tax=Sinorhizobium sp. BG8 TaxID=2613773 RepID=UPI00193CC0B8|nr:histidinol-phosphate transaminase [Sinorhizobium sp. BG8]QRM57481.1 histidinol-phosphate transaminase [Sinorhizobium sp. BG8]
MADPTRAIRDEVRLIAPYNAGLTLDEVRQRYKVDVIAKLGSNENPLGPSGAIRGLLDGIHDLARLYPDPEGRELCAALARDFGVGDGQIILGNGSEDLIAVLCRSVVRPGDTVTTLYPSFPLHEDYTTLMGGKVERVEVKPDLTIDLDTLVSCVRAEPRMVMFSNPMNPVGSWLAPHEFAKVIEALDDETLLVVDEAYAEYAKGEDYPSAVEMLRDTGKNWVVLRTFSKAYGLAGLRIGYGIVSDQSLCGFFNRTRTPFNTNVIAQLSALAALADTDHLRQSIDFALRERIRVAAALTELGYRMAPSKGNFLFFDATENASRLSEEFLKRGVIVKPWKQAGFDTFVRVSIGSAEENNHFLQALRDIKSSR